MIKKLRRKFILLSMLAFLAVLVIIIGSINVVNYFEVLQDADMLLDILSENRGDFPRLDDIRPDGGRPDDDRGFGGLMPRLPDNLSPEAPYENRYFTVTLNAATGAVVQVETSRITAVDAEAAIGYAQAVFSSGRDRGFTDSLRYRRQTEDNTVRIVFLDCGRKLDAFRTFLIASAAISLLGYLIVFVLIAVFSGRIIRPVSESYEKQKRFITDAGHEIKTPLSIIAADTDVLALEVGENEFLDDIRRQTKRLTALTGDLTALSRMEEDGASLPMIEFPVSDIVQETAASFQSPAQMQNKTFTLEIQPGLSIKGNEKAVSQLTSILLDNAVKYSPAGGVIRITLKAEGRGVVLSVYNTTAAPVARESLPRLFDRFYRTDASRNSETGGHGIGLSIAQAIVNAHGGRIRALSDDAHSLEIRAQLPA